MIHAIVVAVVCFVVGVALYPVLITVLTRVGAGQRVQAYNPVDPPGQDGHPDHGWPPLLRHRGRGVAGHRPHPDRFRDRLRPRRGAPWSGFLDDLANVRGLGSLGLGVRQKLVLQAVVGVAVGFGLHAVGASAQDLPLAGMVDLGWAIVPLSAIAVVATTNAVNLTDGVDGLAASCVAIALVGALAASLWLGPAGAPRPSPPPCSAPSPPSSSTTGTPPGSSWATPVPLASERP